MFKLCPPEIQYILLAHLENYFAHKHPLFADFWEMSDGALAMEISREACLLPMEWVDTCKVRAYTTEAVPIASSRECHFYMCSSVRWSADTVCCLSA